MRYHLQRTTLLRELADAHPGVTFTESRRTVDGHVYELVVDGQPLSLAGRDVEPWAAGYRAGYRDGIRAPLPPRRTVR